MSLAVGIGFAILFLVTGVHLMPVSFKGKNEHAKYHKKESSTPECFYKIVGEQGAVYSSHYYSQNTTCEWNIDVRKGFAAVLEFEYLELPVVEGRPCEYYVEISYEFQGDSINRKICPEDKVGRIYTESQVVIIRYHHGIFNKEDENSQFGFKVNYSAVSTTKSQFGSNSAVIILMVVLGSTFTFAVGLFCVRCRLCRRTPRGVQSPTDPQAPNAPTRQELQEIFELQRSLVRPTRREPKKLSFSIFQSESSSSDGSNLKRWSSNEHLPSASTYVVPRTAEKEISKISIGTTPRTVFPELRQKWSQNSLNRIDHLRTKLVARFSSVSSYHSSDVSVFFPASDRNVYSQLSCDEDNELENPTEDRQESEARTRRETTKQLQVPKIVIEFVE